VLRGMGLLNSNPKFIFFLILNFVLIADREQCIGGKAKNVSNIALLFSEAVPCVFPSLPSVHSAH